MNTDGNHATKAQNIISNRTQDKEHYKINSGLTGSH